MTGNLHDYENANCQHLPVRMLSCGHDSNLFDQEKNNCCHLMAHMMHLWHDINVEHHIECSVNEFAQSTIPATAQAVVARLLAMRVIKQVYDLDSCHFMRLGNVILPYANGLSMGYDQRGHLAILQIKKLYGHGFAWVTLHRR